MQNSTFDSILSTIDNSVQFISDSFDSAQSCPTHEMQHARLSCPSPTPRLKLMSIKSVMPSNHLILCCPLLLPSVFPRSGSFPVSQFFASGGQSIRVSASTSFLPVDTQD